MENSINRTLASLGLTNLASVGWEVMPYSFVIDWAVPVGNWLNLQDADTGLEYVQGCVSSTIRQEQRGASFEGLNGLSYPDPNWSITSGSSSDIRQKAFRFRRYVYYEAPNAFFPRLRNPHSGEAKNTRLTSAIALITGAFK
jgi:hypothetical protein